MQELLGEKDIRTMCLMDTFRGSGSLRGPCPIHGGSQGEDGRRSRSFSVDLRKNIFRCFHPDCGVQGNVLDFWAAYHGLSLRDAALQLHEGFHPRGREEEPVPSLFPEPSDDETTHYPLYYLHGY